MAEAVSIRPAWGRDTNTWVMKRIVLSGWQLVSNGPSLKPRSVTVVENH